MRYLFLALLLLIPTHLYAQEMKSPSYTLELEQIEASASAKTSTLNPLQEKQFFENGYIIQPTQNKSLLFTISDTSITVSDFKKEPVQNHSVLTTVNAEDTYGYQILAKPIQALETTGGDQIPHTTCNMNQETCTPFSARVWTSTKNSGWGYNLSGPDAPLDFKNDTYFRSFKTGDPIIFATNNATSGQRAIKLTIKTVTNAEVADGNYGSVIKIIALPKL